MKQSILTLSAATIGGVLGYLIFFWVARQGFYGLIIPGGCLGLAASMTKNRSLVTVLICGAFALLLGIYTEWRFAPFIDDNSFSYFIVNLHKLKPVTLLMIAAGTGLGVYLPYQQLERVANQ